LIHAPVSASVRGPNHRRGEMRCSMLPRSPAPPSQCGPCGHDIQYGNPTWQRCRRPFKGRCYTARCAKECGDRKAHLACTRIRLVPMIASFGLDASSCTISTTPAEGMSKQTEHKQPLHDSWFPDYNQAGEEASEGNGHVCEGTRGLNVDTVGGHHTFHEAFL
jgi:hypothetical protein